MVRGGVEQLHKLVAGTLDIGTGCSGTDIWVGCVVALAKLWKDMFGLIFHVRHRIACGNVEFKRLFISEHWSPEHMFPDLLQLGNATATDASNKIQAVPFVVMWCCGIECDSISALSHNAGANRSCVEAGKGRTGSIAKGHMDFIRAHRPPIWIAENVRNLHVKDPATQLSNLDSLIAQANELGYVVLATVMEASSYGLPQSRSRYYIVGVLVSCFPIDQRSEQWQEPDWVAPLCSMLENMQVHSAPWCEFLLRSDDPLVLNVNQSHHSEREPAKKRKKPQPQQEGPDDDIKKLELYEVDHADFYLKHKMQWPPQFTADFQRKIACVTERQAQVLWLLEHTSGRAADLKCLRVRDLTLSVGWGSEREDLCPCIVSSSWLWARGPVHRPGGKVEIIDRLLCGEEALLLQGFDLDLQAQACDPFMWTYREKLDLAGNAFAGPCSFALLTALMAFAPLGLAFSEDVKSLQVDRQNSHDDGKIDAESGHEDDGEGEGGESESPVGDDFEMVSPASMNSSS